MKTWTEADRKKNRIYFIYDGRKLHERFFGNLYGATERWEAACKISSKNSTITLYHDKRRIENQCCQETTQNVRPHREGGAPCKLPLSQSCDECEEREDCL